MQRLTYTACAFALLACGRVDFETRPDSTTDMAVDAAELGPCTGPLIFDDTFDTAGAGPIFELSTNSQPTATETAGELLFDLTGPINGRAYRVYRTVTLHPVAGLCLVAEVSRIVTCSQCGTFIKIFDTSNAAEHFAYRDGITQLAMRTQINAVGGAGMVDHQKAIPLDLDTARFWRIQQVGASTFWDTSADGVRFFRHTEVTNLFSDATVTISLGAGTEVPTTGGGIAGFARVTANGM